MSDSEVFVMHRMLLNRIILLLVDFAYPNDVSGREKEPKVC